MLPVLGAGEKSWVSESGGSGGRRSKEAMCTLRVPVSALSAACAGGVRLLPMNVGSSGRGYKGQQLQSHADTENSVFSLDSIRDYLLTRCVHWNNDSHLHGDPEAF